MFAGLELYADEAYYWLWSTRLAAGYFDHPPLVAWIPGASSLFPGELGLRSLFLLCGGLFVVFAGLVARELAPQHAERAAVLAALLAATAPMLTVVGSLALPDAPQLAAYACATWLVARATGPSWIAAGGAWGLAMLAKVSSGVLGPALLLALPLDRSLRAELRTRWPYLGVLAALLVFLPCLAWNASHDFVSFSVQLRHGFHGMRPKAHVGEYLAAVVTGAGPVALVVGLGWFLRTRSAASVRVGLVTVTPLALTFASSMRGNVEANWPALAYPGLCAGAGALLASFPRAARWLVGASVAVGVASAAVYAFELRHPTFMSPRAAPIERFHGWRTQVARIGAACGGGEPFVHVSNYQTASQIAWHTGWRRFSPTFERRSQFDVWNDVPRPGEPRCVVSIRPLNGDERRVYGIPANVEPTRIDAQFAGATFRPLWVAPLLPDSAR